MALKNFLRKTTLVILLVVVILANYFLVQDVVYECLIYHAISGISYAASPAKKSAKGPFFYPAPEQEPSEIFQKKKVEYPFTFIVYGDSREPAGYEKDAVINQIIRKKPDFVIHTGDIVQYGEEHQWQIFDVFDGKIIDSGIPMYPVIGNHEYHTRTKRYPSDPNEPLQYYFKRFDFLKKKRWYSFVYGNCLFLMLDSNTDYSPESNQYKWLADKLKGEPPTFLFITFHHPPYTKCGGYKAGRSKSERILSDLFESYKDKKLTKTDIVFSGHVHNYERYRYNDINYVVTGGGGAPQHDINRGPEDFYKKAGATYHYCKIIVSETKVTFEMFELNKALGTWVAGDTFTISK